MSRPFRALVSDDLPTQGYPFTGGTDQTCFTVRSFPNSKIILAVQDNLPPTRGEVGQLAGRVGGTKGQPEHDWRNRPELLALSIIHDATYHQNASLNNPPTRPSADLPLVGGRRSLVPERRLLPVPTEKQTPRDLIGPPDSVARTPE